MSFKTTLSSTFHEDSSERKSNPLTYSDSPLFISDSLAGSLSSSSKSRIQVSKLVTNDDIIEQLLLLCKHDSDICYQVFYTFTSSIFSSDMNFGEEISVVNKENLQHLMKFILSLEEFPSLPLNEKDYEHCPKTSIILLEESLLRNTAKTTKRVKFDKSQTDQMIIAQLYQSIGRGDVALSIYKDSSHLSKEIKGMMELQMKGEFMKSLLGFTDLLNHQDALEDEESQFSQVQSFKCLEKLLKWDDLLLNVSECDDSTLTNARWEELNIKSMARLAINDDEKLKSLEEFCSAKNIDLKKQYPLEAIICDFIKENSESVKYLIEKMIKQSPVGNLEYSALFSELLNGFSSSIALSKHHELETWDIYYRLKQKKGDENTALKLKMINAAIYHERYDCCNELIESLDYDSKFFYQLKCDVSRQRPIDLNSLIKLSSKSKFDSASLCLKALSYTEDYSKSYIEFAKTFERNLDGKSNYFRFGSYCHSAIESGHLNSYFMEKFIECMLKSLSFGCDEAKYYFPSILKLMSNNSSLVEVYKNVAINPCNIVLWMPQMVAYLDNPIVAPLVFDILSQVSLFK